MKTRSGFVSNSSSSSFCIYGVYVDDVSETLRKLCKELQLEVQGTPYDNYCVGCSYSNIKDEETGKSFKESVKEKLVKAGITEEPGYCEQAWYDG